MSIKLHMQPSDTGEKEEVGKKILRNPRSHPRQFVGKRTAQNKTPSKTSAATAK